MSELPDRLDWDRLTDDIRRAADCVDLYRRLHSAPAGNIRDGGTVRCIAPNHADDDPSMSLFEDGFSCNACEAGGDVFDLWALAHDRGTEGESFKRTVRELADNCGLNLESYTPNGETVDPPEPPPREESPTAPTERTVPPTDADPAREPSAARREIFGRLWKRTYPLELTDAARSWLEGRTIDPTVAVAYGCRDWHEAMGEILDVLRGYEREALHRAGLVNDDGEAWWPLRTYIDDDRDPCRGLCIPVWHPNHPEAPVAVRWRVYQPGDDFPPKAFQQPSGPGRFRPPPLGLCQPPATLQTRLSPLVPPGVSHGANPEGVRAVAERMQPIDQFDTTPDVPDPYAVVLCEGATDWLSAATAALDLFGPRRVFPVAITGKGATDRKSGFTERRWLESWTELIAGADRWVAMFDGDLDDPDCKGRELALEVYGQLVAGHPRGTDAIDDRYTFRLRPEDDDLNDRLNAGDLADYIRINALEDDR